jgi:hypothetical protein
MLTLFVIILLVSLITLAFSFDAYYQDSVIVTMGVIAFAVAFTLLILSVDAISSRVNFPADLARIEQLRKDVAKVNLKNAEDVYGQATAANQKIVEIQAKNKMFVYDQLITDKWDGVKIIEIPQQ